ncbi:MAG: hypothetical protein ACFBSF_01625 [Leptolyngbyaceae cyanobacterium]
MPQQQDVSEAAYYVGANVEVSPGAVIAAGVVLQAALDSQLVIEAGVCIGTGVVVQAYGGKLTLAAGSSVGQGTLLLGSGIIGSQACVGAESTLINPAIAANQVVPAQSLLGDTSRSLIANPDTDQTAQSPNGKVSTFADAASHADSETAPDTAADLNGHGSAIVTNSTVYGREQVLKLVETLFPHRNATMSNSD